MDERDLVNKLVTREVRESEHRKPTVDASIEVKPTTDPLLLYLDKLNDSDVESYNFEDDEKERDTVLTPDDYKVPDGIPESDI